MKLTKDEIEAIKQVADALNKWRAGDIPKVLKKVSPHGQLVVMVQNQIDSVVLILSAKMQGAEELVQQKFTKLLNQAKLVDNLDGENSDMAYFFEDARLRGLARQLAETLHDIAQIARKERKHLRAKQVLYFILGFVTFLAALLTILHLLGYLEQFNAIIDKILLSK